MTRIATILVGTEVGLAIARIGSIIALRVLKVMTWMHSRMLHWEGNLLLHAVRLQGTAVIVKLLGRVLRLMRQPVRLLGSSLGLESSQAVLGTNSKLEKIPVL